MDFAGFIEQKRSDKSLSFRGLEKLAEDLNHAYIWRLAKGEKEAPSPDTVQKLATALQLDERERQIFERLAQAPVDDALYRLMLDRRDIAWSDFQQVASVSFRGARPTSEADWLKLIDMLKSFG